MYARAAFHASLSAAVYALIYIDDYIIYFAASSLPRDIIFLYLPARASAVFRDTLLAAAN